MQGHHQRRPAVLVRGFNLCEPFGGAQYWSQQETMELIRIRSELDQNFCEEKRSKFLWEVVSSHMAEKGYARNAEECKSKWKDLVARYKEKDSLKHEIPSQFPFQEELRSIFAARMQRFLWLEPEGGSSSSTNKRKTMSKEFFDEEEDDDDEAELREETTVKQRPPEQGKKKKKQDRFSRIKAMLEEFTRQQQAMDAQWKERMESRERERRVRELEWRQTMEGLERERIQMERSWREREEQRREREDARSDKRHTLLTALLSKLTRDDK